MKEVQYLPIKDIKFTLACGTKRTLDEQTKLLADPEEHPDVIDLDTYSSNSGEKSKKVGTRSTDAELSLLFAKLSVAGTMPGILSVIPGHSENFVSKSANEDFLQPLTSLKSLKYVEMEYHDLLEAYESVSLNVTQKMA